MRGYLDLEIAFPETHRKLGGNARSSAEQEQPEAPPRAQGCKGRNEIDSRDGSPYPAALPARGPNDPRTVSQAEVRRLEDPGELTVFECTHHELRVHSGHEVVSAFINERLDAREGTLHIDAVHPHTEHP